MLLYIDTYLFKVATEIEGWLNDLKKISTIKITLSEVEIKMGIREQSVLFENCFVLGRLAYLRKTIWG